MKKNGDSKTAAPLDGCLITEPTNPDPIQELGENNPGENPILAYLVDSVRKRFLKKTGGSTDPEACWIYAGSQTQGGYGRFWICTERGEALAHRVGWVLAHNEDIPSSREIHHTCKTRLCVNPLHLQAVTHSENMSHVAAKPCTDHSESDIEKDDRGRLYCRSCFADRAWDHTLRFPTTEQSLDMSLTF